MKNKTILITGGTGSLGQAIVKLLLSLDAQKIIVFSRDEFKQVDMKRTIEDPGHKVRYFIGDVRDRDRLNRAFIGVDYVIHCAALKHVDAGEYNPSEFVKTNVFGAQNIIDAALDSGVKKVLGVSSDKAVNPISLYGATKLCADKLFVAANAYSGKLGTKFSVIRYGNFIGSRGSVVPYWQELKERGENIIPVTDPEMTRYWITLEDAALRAFEALEDMVGGEIYVPKMEQRKIVDVAREIHPKAIFEYIGKRKGEKIHEEIVPDWDDVKERGNLWVTAS